MAKKTQTKRSRSSAKREELVSMADLCASIGVGWHRLDGMIARGEIPADCFVGGGSGRKVRKSELDRAVQAGRAALEDEQKGAALPDGLDFENPETWPQDLDGLRIVREWWTARHAKRKDDLAAGELLRAEEVRKHVFNLFRITRDRLLKLPENVAADVSAALNVPDANAVRDAMRSGVERILTDLATSVATIARPPTDDSAAA